MIMAPWCSKLTRQLGGFVPARGKPPTYRKPRLAGRWGMCMLPKGHEGPCKTHLALCINEQEFALPVAHTGAVTTTPLLAVPGRGAAGQVGGQCAPLKLSNLEP